MPMPTNAQMITVTHTYVRTDGSPSEGKVRFRPAFMPVASDRTGNVTVTAWEIERKLSPLGMISANLLANNDPDVVPRRWTYHVTEEIDAVTREYDILLDAFGPQQVDLADLIPVEPSGGTYSTEVDQNTGIASARTDGYDGGQY